MKTLDGKTALVTGGSRGLGKGIVRTLAGAGATVWAVARDAEKLDALKQEISGVQTLAADITDPDTAPRVLRQTRPDIVVLNAGATPHMGPVYEQTWRQFSIAWETDVQSTFYFGQEFLRMPLAPGSTVMIISSGAGIGGSFLSGGYAGAKRMQWFLADYFQEESDALNLGIRFRALLPRQIVGTTDLGHVAASGYAARKGISKEAFLQCFNTPLTPDKVGQGVLALLTDKTYAGGLAYSITGDKMELLDE